jgi:hypothetical protein
MADFQNATVGPITIADGQEARLRLGRDRELIHGDAGKGRFYENVSRGNVWTISTPTGGIIVTANMLVSVASGNGIIALYNPTGNNKNLSILRAVVVCVSGTQATGGGFTWGCVPTPSGATGASAKSAPNNLTGQTGGHSAKPYDGSGAVVGAAVANILRHFGAGYAGVTVAGTLFTINEMTDGDIVVSPGEVVGIYGLVATTALVVNASITWAELAT